MNIRISWKIIAVVTCSILIFSTFGLVFATNPEQSVVNYEQNAKVMSWTVVHPPSIVIQSFEDILSEPGTYWLSNISSLVSTHKTFVISMANLTVEGHSGSNMSLIISTENSSTAFVLGQSDGSEYNMTVGIFNITLSPRGQNVTEWSENIVFFLAFSSLVVKADTFPGGGSCPDSTWSSGMSASADSFLIMTNDEIKGPYPAGYIIFQWSITANLCYNSTTIQSGYVQIVSSYSTTITNPLTGDQMQFIAKQAGGFNGDENYIYLWDSKGFSYVALLPSYGSPGAGFYDNSVSYTYQYTTLYASAADGGGVTWWQDNSYVAIVKLTTSLSIPKLT